MARSSASIVRPCAPYVARRRIWSAISPAMP